MSNKLKEKTCMFCGKQFKGASNRLTCGSEECQRLLRMKRYKKPGAKIRPYTKTSVMMISRDLKEGLSVEEMARIYDRDVEDLRQFVEKIRKAGIVDYVNYKLDKYHRARNDLTFARKVEFDVDLRERGFVYIAEEVQFLDYKSGQSQEQEQGETPGFRPVDFADEELPF